jgi:hypothetical protein
MSTIDLRNLWAQMSPAQRAKLMAILVEMLLRRWSQATEAQHDPA